MNMRAPSSSFALASPASVRGQFQEYHFARSSKALPTLPDKGNGGAKVMSYTENRKTLRAKSDEAALDLFTDAVRSVSVKLVSVPGVISEDTVVAWRRGQRPRFDKAIIAARSVPVIRDAILEILGVEMPEKNRVIARLLCCLADIAGGADQVSAARARLALSEFAEAEP